MKLNQIRSKPGLARVFGFLRFRGNTTIRKHKDVLYAAKVKSWSGGTRDTSAAVGRIDVDRFDLGVRIDTSPVV